MGFSLSLSRGEGRGEGEPSVAHPTVQSVASGARLWSQTQPQHVALPGSVRDFGHAAAGASHTYLWSVAEGILPAVEPSILPGGFGAANREVTADAPMSGRQDAALYGRRGRLPLRVGLALNTYVSCETP